MNRSRVSRATFVCLAALILITSVPRADYTAQSLPLSQDWTNTGLITANDNWDGVPGIVGFLGRNMAGSTAVDPQTIVGDGSASELDVIANQTNTGISNGGVAEFHTPDPVIALQGSGTARAPHILLTVNTSGRSSINVSYNLRDIDGTTDNAVSRVALQYRVGSSGVFSNVPAAYVADASEGPSLAGKVTSVSATLPAAASDKPLVQLRIISSDAVGNDEWIGIDDISITGQSDTPTPPQGVGTASPSIVAAGDTALLTVAVTPGGTPTSTGLTVTGNLGAIGGSTTQPFFDNGQNGDAVAGDLTFSYLATVTGTAGPRTLSATINDAQGRSGLVSLNLSIAPPPIGIHVVQGSGFSSTYAGQIVTTTGVVTALRASSFYIQSPDPAADADPNTSEGLLIFTGSPRPGGFTVGDLVTVIGTVTEFRGSDPQAPPVTEMTNVTVRVTATGQVLPTPAVLLPEFTTPTGGLEQLERFEGMRVRANLTAITGTDGSKSEANATSVSNGDFQAVISGVARPMREPGLEPGQTNHSGVPNVPLFDGNPERLRVDSNAQIGAVPIEIVAGQTIDGLTGVLDYGSRTYTIVPDPGAWTPAGRGEAVPVPAPAANEFTVASFNMERFYDDINDPDVGDTRLNTAAYSLRLGKASLAIRNVLRMPDILGVEEVEKLTVLQAIAARVNADAVAAGGPDPAYVAYLIEGNDQGGIDVGFLVKSSRVDVLNVWQEGKDATYIPPGSNPAPSLLNDRPPLLLEAAIRAEGATPFQVTVIVNHLRSLIDIDAPDGRVPVKRRAQAEFLANLIQARQAANPNERIVTVGDYNAFQFNDGYADVIGTITGQPTPADQVAAASADLVNPDLFNLGDALGAEQYSYIFEGNAQAIDHILVTAPARRRFSRMVYARSNADFPESLRGDATRPERLSDHDMPVAYFTLPGAPVVVLNGSDPFTVEAATTFTDPGAVAYDDEYPSLDVTPSGVVNTALVGSYTVSYTASNGFLSTTTTRTVNVVDTTAPVLTLTGGSPVTVEVGSTWNDPGATATDTRAGDLTAAITRSGALNTAVVGSYSLTYSVSDGYNTTSATRVVNVVDTTAPAIGPITVTPALIAVPNHKMVEVALAYAVTDAAGAPVCSVQGITSNEPVNGPGDGHTFVDWQLLDATHVRVRAERSGHGVGRIYTITVRCADASNNASTGTATVTVRK